MCIFCICFHIKVDSDFFNEYIPLLIRSRIGPDILSSLVSLSLCYQSAKRIEPICDYTILRWILERATNLRNLAIFTDVVDVDSAFADVHINAPLQRLELGHASDVTINAISTLRNTLTDLFLDNCDKITNDGSNF